MFRIIAKVMETGAILSLFGMLLIVSMVCAGWLTVNEGLGPSGFLTALAIGFGLLALVADIWKGID